MVRMKTNELMASVKKVASKTKMKVQKRSPEILLAAGIIGLVTSTVLACKASTKIGDILDDHQESMDEIKHGLDNPDKLTEEYTPEDAKKDTTIVYVNTGVKFVKLFAPVAILGAASIFSILASHNIMNQRNAALASAYAAVDHGFKEYRERVKDKYGDEVDKEMRFGTKAENINVIETDEEGKDKKVKKAVNVVDRETAGDYTFFFDELSPYWVKDGDYNRTFLLAQQQYANDRLRARGYLFLNEVLSELGLPLTKAGQIVGWIYNPNNPSGDNYIDFGIFEGYSRDEVDAIKAKTQGMKSHEVYGRYVMLDFNVDGNIWDKI